MLDQPTPTKPVHPFTKSGMGRSPFRFLYAVSIPSAYLAEANPTAYNNALRDLPRDLSNGCGTCANCGMAIMNIFVVQNADGIKYGVGCDCVEKTDDHEITAPVRRAAADLERGKRNQKRSVVAAIQAELDAVMLTLPSGKHVGKTAAEVAEADPNYAEWVVTSNSFSNLAFWRSILEETPVIMALRAREKAAADAVAARRENPERLAIADRENDVWDLVKWENGEWTSELGIDMNMTHCKPLSISKTLSPRLGVQLIVKGVKIQPSLK